MFVTAAIIMWQFKLPSTYIRSADKKSKTAVLISTLIKHETKTYGGGTIYYNKKGL